MTTVINVALQKIFKKLLLALFDYAILIGSYRQVEDFLFAEVNQTGGMNGSNLVGVLRFLLRRQAGD